MRKRHLLLFMAALFIANGARASEKADDIVRSIEANLAPSGVEALYQFTNYRPDGVVMKYEVLFRIKDVNHSHAYFQKPEREKGREVLRLTDTMWTWMPTVGRAVRIADKDSFAGGDFSNADILRIDWLNRYNASIKKELPNQWIIDLEAKVPDAPYQKMRLWVDKKTRQPVQQYFYDSHGTLLKRCLYGSVRSFGKLERPSQLVMENVITKQKSELIVVSIRDDNKIPDSRFTVDNLGK